MLIYTCYYLTTLPTGSLPTRISDQCHCPKTFFDIDVFYLKQLYFNFRNKNKTRDNFSLIKLRYCVNFFSISWNDFSLINLSIVLEIRVKTPNHRSTVISTKSEVFKNPMSNPLTVPNVTALRQSTRRIRLRVRYLSRNFRQINWKWSLTMDSQQPSRLSGHENFYVQS